MNFSKFSLWKPQIVERLTRFDIVIPERTHFIREISVRAQNSSVKAGRDGFNNSVQRSVFTMPSPYGTGGRRAALACLSFSGVFVTDSARHMLVRCISSARRPRMSSSKSRYAGRRCTDRRCTLERKMHMIYTVNAPTPGANCTEFDLGSIHHS